MRYLCNHDLKQLAIARQAEASGQKKRTALLKASHCTYMNHHLERAIERKIEGELKLPVNKKNSETLRASADLLLDRIAAIHDPSLRAYVR